MTDKQQINNKELLYIIAREVIDLYREKPDSETVESIAEICFALMRLTDENPDLQISREGKALWLQLYNLFDRGLRDLQIVNLEELDQIYRKILLYFDERSP